MSISFRTFLLGVVAAGLTCGIAMACYVVSERRAILDAEEESPQWAAISEVNTANLTTCGKNAYFNLEPGYRLHFSDGSLTRTLTVRRKTRMVDGVETRVVEEKEEEHGRPTKVVWKYYAIDETSGALYCFGVHVQNYHDGKLVNHRGWRSGVHGAVFRLVMPATPKAGDTLVRGHGRRTYEVLDTDATAVTHAGTFTNCLRIQVKETGESEPRERLFAPGVGLVRDGRFDLVKIARTVWTEKSTVAAD
jgi:hypothetical protein